jgi:folate-dependent phosphoribosylglycinamide formyltransferase PurN
MKPWIAFFSQTGNELTTVCSKLNRLPDAVITNRQDLNFNQRLKENDINLIHLSKKPSIEEYIKVLSRYKNPIITLHGFLRILPEDICNDYEIYNLHPGLITKYPELKGKDPQLKAIDLKHPTIGCVIHKVIPEVDSGEILLEKEIIVTDYNFVFNDLHKLAVDMWVDFLSCR